MNCLFCDRVISSKHTSFPNYCDLTCFNIHNAQIRWHTKSIILIDNKSISETGEKVLNKLKYHPQPPTTPSIRKHKHKHKHIQPTNKKSEVYYHFN